MAVLDTAIHAVPQEYHQKQRVLLMRMDARIKSGHDGKSADRSKRIFSAAL